MWVLSPSVGEIESQVASVGTAGGSRAEPAAFDVFAAVECLLDLVHAMWLPLQIGLSGIF
jgi:hypothetical protein